MRRASGVFVVALRPVRAGHRSAACLPRLSLGRVSMSFRGVSLAIALAGQIVGGGHSGRPVLCLAGTESSSRRARTRPKRTAAGAPAAWLEAPQCDPPQPIPARYTDDRWL